MRERIASIISLNKERDSGFIADDVLEAVCQEIEKVENPYYGDRQLLTGKWQKPNDPAMIPLYEELKKGQFYIIEPTPESDSFEDCRQKILACFVKNNGIHP